MKEQILNIAVRISRLKSINPIRILMYLSLIKLQLNFIVYLF